MRLNKILKNLIIIFCSKFIFENNNFPWSPDKQSKYQIKSKSMIMNHVPHLTSITVLMKPQRLTDSMALPVVCGIPSDEPIPLIDQVDCPQCGIQPECCWYICYTHYLNTDIKKSFYQIIWIKIKLKLWGAPSRELFHKKITNIMQNLYTFLNKQTTETRATQH